MYTYAATTQAESTVEALASADMMYLIYSMARIRPIVPNIFILQRLEDVQAIKGLEMDAVLLQFWLAGLTGLAESTTLSQRLIWKSIVLVKIPSIVSQLRYTREEIYDILEITLRQLSFYRGVLNECDENIAEDNANEKADILKSIAIGCYSRDLVRPNNMDILNGVTISPSSTSDPKFGNEGNQPSIEAIDDLCGRALSDFEQQEKLIDCIIKVCEDAGNNGDVSTLSKLCQTLDDNPLLLDLIHLLREPSALLVPLENFVNKLQQDEDDDIDTCNTKLEGFGIVLILVMTVIRRYELAGCLDTILHDKNGFCYLWLHRTSATIPAIAMTSMTSDMQALMGRWITALFDSMGISDNLIQTSKPQMLLEIAPSIFEQSLAACQGGVIDSTTLNSGLDYFLQPCLLFVLIGVVQYLCEEIVSSPTSCASYSSITNQAGSASTAQSMLSPTGHVIPPLTSRNVKPMQSLNANGGTHEQKMGKNVASLAMMQASLKSLLAGDAFPSRVMRLLKIEIAAALEHPSMESDHQMRIIQGRLDEASFNYYPWSVSDAYDVPKLLQQTSLAFGTIISGARTSMVSKRENGWPVFGGSCYHIDVDLFRTTLCYLGPAQFVTTILKQLLKAALTPNGLRAAEMGAVMMTTPLVNCSDHYLAPQSLVWTLIYQTLWIPVPGRLETFVQGKLLATFVGMTLDYFQSRTLIQQRLRQHKAPSNGSQTPTMDVDPVAETAVHVKDAPPLLMKQLERYSAVEPFRVMLYQRLKDLEPIARDRPGFEGFVQGMTQYRERHPPLSLPLQQQPRRTRQD